MSWKRGHADGSENEEEPFDEQMLLGEDDDSYLNDDNGEEHASLLDDEDDVAVYSNTQFHTNQTHEQTLPDAELSEGELEVDDALLNDSGEEGSYGEERTVASHLIDEEETTSSGPIISTLDTQVNEEEYQEFTESPNEIDQQQTEAKIPAAYEHSNENIQKSQPFLPRGHRNRPRHVRPRHNKMVNHFSTNARAQFQHPYQFARAPPFGNPVPQYRPPSLMTHGPPRVPNFQQMNMNPLYHQQSLMTMIPAGPVPLVRPTSAPRLAFMQGPVQMQRQTPMPRPAMLRSGGGPRLNMAPRPALMPNSNIPNISHNIQNRSSTPKQNFNRVIKNTHNFSFQNTPRNPANTGVKQFANISSAISFKGAPANLKNSNVGHHSQQSGFGNQSNVRPMVTKNLLVRGQQGSSEMPNSAQKARERNIAVGTISTTVHIEYNHGHNRKRRSVEDETDADPTCKKKALLPNPSEYELKLAAQAEAREKIQKNKERRRIQQAKALASANLKKKYGSPVQVATAFVKPLLAGQNNAAWQTAEQDVGKPGYGLSSESDKCNQSYLPDQESGNGSLIFQGMQAGQQERPGNHGDHGELQSSAQYKAQAVDQSRAGNFSNKKHIMTSAPNLSQSWQSNPQDVMHVSTRQQFVTQLQSGRQNLSSLNGNQGLPKRQRGLPSAHHKLTQGQQGMSQEQAGLAQGLEGIKQEHLRKPQGRQVQNGVSQGVQYSRLHRSQDMPQVQHNTPQEFHGSPQVQPGLADGQHGMSQEQYDESCHSDMLEAPHSTSYMQSCEPEGTQSFSQMPQQWHHSQNIVSKKSQKTIKIQSQVPDMSHTDQVEPMYGDQTQFNNQLQHQSYSSDSNEMMSQLRNTAGKSQQYNQEEEDFVTKMGISVSSKYKSSKKRIHPLDMLSRDAELSHLKSSNKSSSTIHRGSNKLPAATTEQNSLSGVSDLFHKDSVRAFKAHVNPRLLKNIMPHVTADKQKQQQLGASTLTERFNKQRSDFRAKVQREVISEAKRKVQLQDSKTQAVKPAQEEPQPQKVVSKVITTKGSPGEKLCCKVINVDRSAPVSVIRELGEKIGVVTKVGRLKKNLDVVVIIFAEEQHAVGFRRQFNNTELLNKRIKVEFISSKKTD